MGCPDSVGVGLLAAAILLAPWHLRFSLDARQLYSGLYEQAIAEAEAQALGWLAVAGFGHQDLHDENAVKARRMSWLSGTLGVLTVLQTFAWMSALAIS